MRSASPHPTRLAAVALGAALLLGGLAGCQTTQEKAAEHQAKAQRILDARAERQAKKHADGTKTGHIDPKSAHRPEEGAQ